MPIDTGTAFRIASVSKQFTCAAILMLAAEGRLELEDEARSHLPELPDFGQRITVSHLMHNTSGIRDMLEIMRLGGADLGEPVTRADLIDGICRQRGLNFVPGTRYLYSNSNFLLLGVIVERLSGERLPDFLRHRIFEPLGMTMTRMTESVLEPAPGLATGYFPSAEGGWQRAPHAFPLGGEGGLVSSVQDLALWARNMETHRVGGADLAAGLEQVAPFVNGVPNGYAHGLQVGKYRGLRTLGHGGLWPGYKTQYLRVPDRRLAVIAISNNGTADPYHLAQNVVDVLIEGTPGIHAMPDLPPPSELESYAGRWIDPESGYTVDIKIGADGVPEGRTWGVPFRLHATSDGRLIASRAARDFVARHHRGADTLEVEADAGFTTTFRRVPANTALPNDLPGEYRNAEIDATWAISADEGRMTVRVSGPVRRGSTMSVIPIDGDFVRIVTPRALFEQWLDVRIMRDGSGAITGLHVDGGRSRNLIFSRIGGSSGD